MLFACAMTILAVVMIFCFSYIAEKICGNLDLEEDPDEENI